MSTTLNTIEPRTVGSNASFVVDTMATSHATVGVDEHRLHNELRKILNTHQAKHEMLGALAQLLTERIVSIAATTDVIYVARDTAGRWQPQTSIDHVAGDRSLRVLEANDLVGVAQASVTRLEAMIQCLPAAPTTAIVAVPVELPDDAPESLIAVIPDLPDERSAVVRTMETAATYITLWHTQHAAQRAEAEAETTAAIQDLLTLLEACPNLRHAGRLLVDSLCSYTGADRVVLALCKNPHGRCRLFAVSGSPEFDRYSPQVADLERALDETLLREQITVWPRADADEPNAARAHRQLCKTTNVASVVSSPLRDRNGTVVGAWSFLGSHKALEQPRTLRVVRAAETSVAGCLALLKRADRGPVARVRDTVAGSKSVWKWAVGMLCMVAVVAAMLVPAAYSISCDCRLEPVVRRFVAVPCDGTLARANVKCGDVVVKGDLLATMDGRELRWELAGVTAERDHAVKQRDAAFANHKFAAANIAKLEVERLELKIDLLKHRLHNLDIVSPIAGVITVGDLETAEGAPVTCGDTLFEVAPLTTMAIEIAIPERELPYVKVGQAVTVRLATHASRPYEARIKRIHPRSEIRDHQNVFIATATIANHQQDLRPGMRGTARVAGPRRTLGWNLLHKPWEALCLTLGW